MTSNNSILDLVNIKADTKFGHILYICSEEIDWKKILTSIKGSKFVMSKNWQVEIQT